MTDLFALYMACSVLTALLVWLGIRVLRKQVLYDMPDDAAGRGIPVPRSGGIAVMPVIFAGIVTLYMRDLLLFPQPLCWVLVLAGGIALTVMAWVDDKRKDGLAARYRYTILMMAVFLPLVMLPPEWRIFGTEQMPLVVERGLIAVMWLWFGSAFNFMDGINGITGVETLAITGGIVALALLSGMGVENGVLELNVIIAGAASGFLFWNGRGKARVFMSDIGTVGLGYVLGWMLVLLAIQGHAAVALILPMVYFGDSACTVLRRLVQGKRIWKNHRDHLYQRAVHDTGLSHMQVTSMIAVTDIVLVVIAMNVVQAVLTPVAGLLCALAVVALLLGILYLIGRRAV